jgi:hypothetical protein
MSKIWKRLKQYWSDGISSLHVWCDNIKRIWDWMPVLCGDWDFDARPGLYQVMYKKMERLEPCLRNGHLVNRERYARQVKVAMAVLDRLIADEYEENELVSHDRRWGKLKIDFKIVSFGYQMTSTRRKVKTLQDQKQERTEFMLAYQRAEARRRRDIDWVFAFIARWHEHWWD